MALNFISPLFGLATTVADVAAAPDMDAAIAGKASSAATGMMGAALGATATGSPVGAAVGGMIGSSIGNAVSSQGVTGPGEGSTPGDVDGQGDGTNGLAGGPSEYQQLAGVRDSREPLSGLFTGQNKGIFS